MKIESVTLTNFQCFGPEGATVQLEEGLTALVGSNGSGKTAIMQGLLRIFGVTQIQRRVTRSDFHLPAESQGLEDGATLSVDVILRFPEVGDEAEIAHLDAVPEYFNQMSIGEPGGPLFARIVLLATWRNDGTVDGTIEEEVRWVQTLENEYDLNDCPRVSTAQRAAIQVVYVPASRSARDPISALLKGRLWKAAKWSDEFRDETSQYAGEIQNAFREEQPSKVILQHVNHRWQQVNDGRVYAKPSLRLVESDFHELLGQADFALYPDEAGNEKPVTQLSDGQRSLFHIALTAATLETERHAFTSTEEESAFDVSQLQRVHLTVLAIEEPENSLAPFFLSRIMTQAREVAEMASAQVLVSSHSPAILGRIDPAEVRYLRLNPDSRAAEVRRLTLPEESNEAEPYVRLAVRAYPELYFAHFVILAEGDSERIVINRVAEAMGIPLDPSFVPVVPLAGRYVGHFWRLLEDIEIPFVTLLDLDLGRSHGGARLIRSTTNSLSEFGRVPTEIEEPCTGSDGEGESVEVNDEQLLAEGGESDWITAMEKSGVYFSWPLDLDFAMLKAFPSAYQHPREGGRGPTVVNEAGEESKKVVLKESGRPELYDATHNDAFIWYRYLFIGGSKPDAHFGAIARTESEMLKERAPLFLKRLIGRVKDHLRLSQSSD